MLVVEASYVQGTVGLLTQDTSAEWCCCSTSNGGPRMLRARNLLFVAGLVLGGLIPSVGWAIQDGCSAASTSGLGDLQSQCKFVASKAGNTVLVGSGNWQVVVERVTPTGNETWVFAPNEMFSPLPSGGVSDFEIQEGDQVTATALELFSTITVTIDDSQGS